MAITDLDLFARPGGWRDLKWTCCDEEHKNLFCQGGTVLIGRQGGNHYVLAWLDKELK